MSLALVATAAPTFGLAASASAVSDPSQVNFTLEGCRNDGTITLPNGSGDFVCPDSAYTTGNLGKGWNELDLVPFRLTTDAGNSAPSSQTYAMDIVVDREDSTRPGYDVLSVPVLNTALSSAGCTAATAGAATIKTPGLGGIAKSLYRTLTITQAKNTKCVYDYYARLALGSHLFPGSSLHANLANQNLGTAGIGSKEVSIPVKEILPQELRKDMTATQGSDHVWNITKGATPARLSFLDTCDDAQTRSAGVTVTVQWEKLAANPSGPITVLTHVYAKNPASRVITVNVTDKIQSGATLLDTASAGPVDVPANTEIEVLQHQTTVPAGTTNLNDVATGTYTDKITNVAVPGTTQATATANVQPTGPELNQSAVITDVETLTGSGLTFAVNSFTGATGAFDGGYVAGTATTGPVSWTSASQSSNGSVVFDKTVFVPKGTITSGTLSDVATLAGSDGFSATANASSAITADARVALTINKTIPDVLGANDAVQTFNFDVTGPGGFATTKTISFGNGEGGSSSPKSVVLTGLVPGSYTVAEQNNPLYGPQTPRTVDISLPKCSDAVTFNNVHGPALAQVQKVTVPAGSEAGWVFDLVRGGNVVGTATTTGAGFLAFSGEGTALLEGTYTVVEHSQNGWDQTNSNGCVFSVNYPADADKLFSCTFTNTQRGSITIVKDAVPDDPQVFNYTTTGSGLSPFTLTDNGTTANTRTFTDLVPGPYGVTETLPVAGWDFTSLNCTSSKGSSTIDTTTAAVASIALGAGDSVTCTYKNTKRADVKVVKTENGGTPTTAYTFKLTGGPDGVNLSKTTDTTNLGTLDFGLLKPGSYTLCELAVPAGTHSTLQDLGGLVNATTGDICLNFTLSAGADRTFTIDNSRPGGGQRTIGYWKNWNSCSTTGNDRLAMALKTGNHLLDEFLPKLLGNYNVDTCAKAVNVLGSASGKYAENQLAAQLLAAKLNVAAGASSCQTVSDAIAHADALLIQIGYNGAPSNKVGNNSPIRTDELNTAALLDNYNNGKVC